MSNETKRDVFKKLLECYEEVSDVYTDTTGEPYYVDDEPNYLDEYDAALSDDLPVIPKTVGEYIQERKAAHDSLAFALTARFIPNEVVEWMFMVAGDPDTELSQIEYVKQQDTFARAWLLGVWCVEETGEVVKL